MWRALVVRACHLRGRLELAVPVVGLADGFAVLGVAGRFALSVPLAETLAAGWLLSRAGIAVPATPMTLAPARPHDHVTVDAGGNLNGRATGVPFARDVPHIAVLAVDGRQQLVALLDVKDCRVSDGHNLAGDAVNVVVFDRVKPLAVVPAPNGNQSSLMSMGSTIRSVETAGALEAILSLGVAYANERVAFERPIGKFQAVQQNLARLAGEVAAALAASGSAADAIAQADTFNDAVFFEAASAGVASLKLPRKARQLRIRFLAPSALPRNTFCTASRCACFPGETTSATKAIGRPSSADTSPAAAPMNSGRWSPRDDRQSAV